VIGPFSEEQKLDCQRGLESEMAKEEERKAKEAQKNPTAGGRGVIDGSNPAHTA
jgi:hypothetical protein